ncbi:hypothetical protein F5884DRAFT_499792 [Xylogone sp. PMI_703]|nr:hypothetical protein F5884DRAFT_499792 [Xylogone sp. PMI_703]
MPTVNVGPESFPELQLIADALAGSKKVVVITGAGISTNCGIPDFRSENGLYSLIQAQYDAAMKQAQDTEDVEERPVKRRRVCERWTYVPIPRSDTDESVPSSPEPSKSSSEPLASSIEPGSNILAETPPASKESVKDPQPVQRRSLRSSLGIRLVEDSVAQATTKPSSFTEKQHLTRRQSLRSAGSAELSEEKPLRTPKKRTPKKRASSQDLKITPMRNLRSRANSEQLNKSALITQEVKGKRTPVNSQLHTSKDQTLPVATVPQDKSKSSSEKLTTDCSDKPANRSRRSLRSEARNINLTETDSSTTPSTPSELERAEESRQTPEPPINTTDAKVDNIPATTEYSAADTITSIPPPYLQKESSTSSTSGNDEPSSTQTSQSSQSSTRTSLPNLKGRDLFDSMIWSNALTTSIFYMFISTLREKIKNDVKTTTDTHKFIKALRDSGRLVRNYTQNIDALEAREGLCTELARGPGNRARFSSKAKREPRPADVTGGTTHDGGVEVVMLHGSLVRLRCSICGKLSDWDEADRQSTTSAGRAPDCPLCSEHSAKREGRGRRRVAIGRLRPDIVLYGEQHPEEQLVGSLITYDLSLGPDVLLILGTSMRVHSLKVMVREFAKAVHLRGGKVIFVNHTKPPESIWGEIIDYWVQWDCDAWVRDLKERRADIWLPQGTKMPKGKETKEKPEPKNPTAVRDDKQNGVYLTFKALDALAKIRDSQGNAAPRAAYYGKKQSEHITIPPLKGKSDIQVVLPAHDPKLSAAETIANSKKRPYRPNATRDDKKNGVYLVTRIIESLRGIISSATKLPLKPRSHNLPTFSSSYSGSADRGKSPSYFPVIPGLAWPSPEKINLPSRSPSEYLTPRTHIYRTPSHSSSKSVLDPVNSSSPSGADHWPSDTIVVSRSPNSQDAIVVDIPGETQDAIVVMNPRGSQRRQQQEQLPSPRASSDSMTPKSQRIKHIGSIDCILSSPRSSSTDPVVQKST